MRRRRRAIVLIALCVLAGAVALFWASAGKPSVSVRFARYGTYRPGLDPYQAEFSNKLCAFIRISNSGPCRVFISGGAIASSPWSQQFVQINPPAGWTSGGIWPCPGLPLTGLTLLRGESRELPILVQTNLPWKVSIQFRAVGMAEQLGLDSSVERSPRFVRRLLRKILPRTPPYRTVWTDPVPQPEGHNHPTGLPPKNDRAE